jgi:sodium/pantothenate symporter
MPTLTVTLLPPVLAGIFIAGPVAAIMSTVDSMLLLACATLIKDIYIHYIHKGDERAAPPRLVRNMCLWTTAGIGMIVFLAAIEPPDLLVWINLFAFGGLEAAFLWPVLLGLYWPRANATGAVWSVVAGVGAFFAISLLKLPLGGVHAIVPTLVVAFVAFLLGVWLGERQNPVMIRMFCDD